MTMKAKPTYEELERRVQELEKIESELEYSREMLRVYQKASLGYQSLDENGHYIAVNQTWLDTLGYAKEEVIGKSFSDFLHPDWRNHFKENFPRFKSIGEILGVEFEMVKKNGNLILVSLTGKISRDEKGNFHQTHCIFHDITERKQAKEALRGNEEKYRCLFESSRDAIMTLEPPSWAFTSGNPATVKMFGAKNENEFVSHGPGALSPERQPDGRASAEKAQEMIETAVREGSHFFEWTHRRIGGKDFPADVLLTRMEQAGKLLLQATVRDLTERKRAEASLKQIEWMLSKKSAPDDAGQSEDHDQGYGDLTELNRDGIILKSIGHERLKSFANDYLELLGTSSAIYEVNGDYAFGIFASGWCRMMDSASRKLCHTPDNVEALNSGRWLCHESCWTDCAKEAIAKRSEVDIECNGGIRLYAVPIFAGGNVIGTINLGYGNPPKDPEKLKMLADVYHLNYDDLLREATAYDSRPPYIIEMAKKRLNNTAKLIGSMVETKQAMEALRDSEEKYRGLIEGLNDTIYRMKLPDGRYEYFSPSVEEVFGYTSEEFINNPLFIQRIIHPDSAGYFKEKWKELLEGKVQEIYEYKIIDPEGNERWIVQSNKTIFDDSGRIKAIEGLCRNVTEHKQAENELKFQNVLLKTQQEVSLDGIIIVDENDKIISFNQRFADIWGIPDNIMSLQSGERALEYVLPKLTNPEEFAKRIHDLHINKQEKSNEEITLIDGKIFDRYSSPMFGSNDEYYGRIWYYRDITERKRAEQALKQSESAVRKKLQAIIEPEGDLGILHLGDIIDFHSIQSMMEDFYRITNFGGAVVDLSGNILVGVEFQDACYKFHRAHPETRQKCLESDIVLSKGIPAGTFKAYKCKNNMWDIATPIMIDGRHLGNIFIGQFFYENEVPDYELFRNQARRYGFDEAEYLAAIDRVPRWSHETVEAVMTFYTKLADMLSSLSYSKIKLARTLAQQQATLIQLSESENKYRTLVENANDIIYSLSSDGIFTYVSPNWTHLLGHEISEVEGHSFALFVHPDDVSACSEFLRKVFESGEKQSGVEYRVLHKDGQWRWHTSNASAKRDKNVHVTEYIGIARDITYQKEAEEALKKREFLLNKIFDLLPLGLWLADENGRLLRGNPAGVKIWGAQPTVSMEEYGVFKASRLPSRQEILPEDWALAHTIKKGITVKDELLEIDAFDGKKKIILNYTAPVLDNNGQLLGAIVMNQDITDQKRAEEEKEKLQVQFIQAQKMESVGRLAGGVAHDINNKMLVISGYAELVQETLKESDPIYEFVGEIIDACKKSTDIVNQLLAFARKQTISPKVCDLNEIVESMLKMIRRLIGEDIDLVWMPDANIWPVKIDSAQIDQILANLCVNARDAITGGGKITIETNNVTIDEEYCSRNAGFLPGQYVMLAVSDNGEGMDKETISNIFEPFFTTKPVGIGTGLGLATVYGIVKQNNGFINVYSEPGKGTTFKIYLPHHAVKDREIQTERTGEISMGHGETILMVEDEIAIMKMGQLMLEKLGYQVLAADTPSKAMHLAKEHPGKIHLLITDVVMPDMNGRDLANQIEDLYPNIKALFMSGYTANVIAHHGVLDKGVHFIQKPFSKKDLAQKLREVLDKAPDETQP